MFFIEYANRVEYLIKCKNLENFKRVFERKFRFVSSISYLQIVKKVCILAQIFIQNDFSKKM